MVKGWPRTSIPSYQLWNMTFGVPGSIPKCYFHTVGVSSGRTRLHFTMKSARNVGTRRLPSSFGVAFLKACTHEVSFLSSALKARRLLWVLKSHAVSAPSWQVHLRNRTRRPARVASALGKLRPSRPFREQRNLV